MSFRGRQLNRGDVYWVKPDPADPAVGHEQDKRRPCVVIASAEVSAALKYPLTAIVPLTSQPQVGDLYPVIGQHPSGLRNVSYALCDQVRAIDRRRVDARTGCVTADELTAIENGVGLFLGLFDLEDDD